MQITDINVRNMTARVTMPEETVTHVKSVLYYAPTDDNTDDPALLARVDAARDAVRHLRRYGDGLMRSVPLDMRLVRDLAVLDDVVTENAKTMGLNDWSALLGLDRVPLARTGAPEIGADRAQASVLGLSLSHVSDTTREILHEAANRRALFDVPVMALMTGDTCHGYIVPLGRQLLSHPAVPYDLNACAAYAMGRGCAYLRLDSIFEPTENLPAYGRKEGV